MTTTPEPLKGVPMHDGNSTYVPRADHNALAAWVRDNMGPFVAARGDLPITGNWVGRTMFVLAEDRLFVNRDGGTNWVPAGPLTNIQLDATNSRSRTITQTGSGMILGTGATIITETITFPVPFASVPRLLVTANGSRAGGFDAAGGSSLGAVFATTVGKSATGATVGISAGGAALSATGWYYDWEAIGVPAS